MSRDRKKHLESMKKWRIKNSEHIKNYNSEHKERYDKWRKGSGKNCRLKAQRRSNSIFRKRLKWDEGLKLKYRAHTIVNNSIQSGKIKKPINCENCNSVKIINGHHTDYNKPLEVKWLCHSCHKKEHMRKC